MPLKIPNIAVILYCLETYNSNHLNWVVDMHFCVSRIHAVYIQQPSGQDQFDKNSFCSFCYYLKLQQVRSFSSFSPLDVISVYSGFITGQSATSTRLHPTFTAATTSAIGSFPTDKSLIFSPKS